jgi:TolB-like protein
MAGEIFISYRRADQDKARLLHALLKQRGVDAWYDALLGAGDDWRNKTAQALEAAPIFVLLFSKVASESDDISKELAAATFSKKLVIPVRIENIKPSGAFLYELASRNWIDAWDDTETKFIDLADKLAALVKGGPSADVAAFNLGAPGPAPKIKQASKGGNRALIITGIIATAVVAIVAMGLYSRDDNDTPSSKHARSQPGAAASQRVAFFGFTNEGDALTKAVAATATDETFTNLNARHVDTSARADTTVDKAAERLARAKDLGARYALSGDVRRDGATILTTMRLEDVTGRTTVWEATRRGESDRPTITAVTAADQAVETTDCFVTGSHAGLAAPWKAGALESIKAGCDALGDSNNSRVRWETTYIAALNDLAHLYPDNGEIWAQIAYLSAETVYRGATPAQQGQLKNADDALASAVRISPDSFATATARAFIGAAHNTPPLDWTPALEASLRRGPKSGEAFAFARASGLAGEAMMALGRLGDSQGYFNDAAQADPVSNLYGFASGWMLSATGSWEAKAQIESQMQKRAYDYGWERSVITATFGGAGDLDTLAKQVPPNVPPYVMPCYRDLAAGLKQKAAATRLAAFHKADKCLTDFDSPHVVFQAAAELGDLDRAFEMLSRPNEVPVLSFAYRYLPWFMPSMKALRADPRFLPLMQKLGYIDYWKHTRTKPDVCSTPEEKDIPFCKALE